MRLETSRLIEARDHFGRLCDLMGYRVGVEVGVDRGAFARQLLSTSRYLFLYLVDPWQPYGEIPQDRQAAKAEALASILPYAGRYAVVEATSKAAAGAVPAPIDFVYVDGAHDYANVLLDLNVWWDRLRPGGMLAGHDFDTQAVQAALRKFFAGRTVYLVPDAPDGEYGIHPSWYAFKP